MSKDYYKILGVDRAASTQEIRVAYRKMALQYHPDRNPDDPGAEDKFKEAAEAYQVLADDNKKAQYDRWGHQGAGHPGFTDLGDIFGAFGDIFGDIFGQGNGFQNRGSSRRAPREGANLKYNIEIDLKDVLLGKQENIAFECEKNCSSCSGQGSEDGALPKVCPSCQGSGQQVKRQGFFSIAAPCSSCKGEGEIIETPCVQCKGSGREIASREMEVSVPKGVRTGTQLRFAQEGEGGYRGGPSGDLYVEIHVRPHSEYKRQHDDLLAALHISYLQAILGAEIEWTTLEGDQITVNVPAGVQQDEWVTQRGLGVPGLRGGHRGDLKLQIKVDIPQKITSKEEKLLREIAQSQGEEIKSRKKGFFG